MKVSLKSKLEDASREWNILHGAASPAATQKDPHGRDLNLNQ
jgi:hypothetical protein